MNISCDCPPWMNVRSNSSLIIENVRLNLDFYTNFKIYFSGESGGIAFEFNSHKASISSSLVEHHGSKPSLSSLRRP